MFLSVITVAFRNYEGVVCVNTGHITGHEGGAIEASGHKVLTMPGVNGKMTAEGLVQFLLDYQADAARSRLYSAVNRILDTLFVIRIGSDCLGLPELEFTALY